jgi:hypothetical protein
MFHFSYTGLRLVHDEMVHNAMKRAYTEAELIRSNVLRMEHDVYWPFALLEKDLGLIRRSNSGCQL